MARIDWSVYEQSQVFTATSDLLKQRKVALPVQSELGLKLFMQAMRDAQVGALPEARRRPLASIEAVGGDLRKRFIDAQILPSNPERYKRGSAKRMGGRAAPVDPKDERIAELESEKSHLESEVADLDRKLEEAQRRIAELEARPDAMTVVRQYVSRMLADALLLADDAKKPAHQRFDSAPPLKPPAEREAVPPIYEDRRKEQVPDFEKERRKTGGAPEPSAAPKLPKILIVGGGSAHQKTALPAAKILNGEARCIFWADESYDLLTDRAKGADGVFILMGATSHDAVGVVAKANKHYQRVIGYSPDHLVNMIRNWLKREWVS